MIDTEYRQVAAVAAEELRDRLCNRWMLVVAVVLAAFSLVVSYFDSAGQGTPGPRSIEFVTTSLISLVTYLIPLTALLLGFDTVVGERERGSPNPLLALPLTRMELLLDKYLRLATAFILSTLGDLALMVVLLWHQFGSAGPYQATGFVLSSMLLGLAFLNLALFASVVSRERIRVSSAATALWFGSTLVLDLLLLGLLVATGGNSGGQALAYLLLLGPTDIFHILNVFSPNQLRGLHSLASIVPPALGNPWVMSVAILAWIATPLTLAVWRLRV